MNDIARPPIGITPRKIYEEYRIRDLMEAMLRYEKVKKSIPEEWMEELIFLINRRLK